LVYDAAQVREELDMLLNELLNEVMDRLPKSSHVRPLSLALKWNGELQLQHPDEDTVEHMVGWLRESLGQQLRLNALTAAAMVYDRYSPEVGQSVLAFELEHQSGEAIWLMLPYLSDGMSLVFQGEPIRYAGEGLPFSGAVTKKPKLQMRFQGKLSSLLGDKPN
jgi:hypothetical protein